MKHKTFLRECAGYMEPEYMQWINLKWSKQIQNEMDRQTNFHFPLALHQMLWNYEGKMTS